MANINSAILYDGVCCSVVGFGIVEDVLGIILLKLETGGLHIVYLISYFSELV